MASSHSIHPTDAGHRSRFTARHVVLIAALAGIGILLSADEALPVFARVPGMIVLAILAIYMLVSGPRPLRH